MNERIKQLVKQSYGQLGCHKRTFLRSRTMKYVVRLAAQDDETHSEYVQSFESRKNAQEYADILNKRGNGYYYVELED